jgi:hypothetical protein
VVRRQSALPTAKRFVIGSASEAIQIAGGCGLALAILLSWEGERLQPDEIKISVIVIIAAAFSRGWWRSRAA